MRNRLRSRLLNSSACHLLAIGLVCLPLTANAQNLGTAFVTLGSSQSPRHVDSLEILLDPMTRKATAPVVTAIAASREGHYLAIAGDDHAIRIVEVATGNTIRTAVGHSDWIQALVFSRDSDTLYSAGNDGLVLSWAHQYPVSSKEIVKLDYAVRTLSLSTEMQLLAIGGFSDEIIVWDLEQAAVRHYLQCECGDQRCVRFSPDGKQLLCGGRDGGVRIWDSQTGVLKASFHEHLDRVHTAAFSADGTKLTSVGEDRCLVRYDLLSQQVMLKREMAQSKLMSMCLINDGMVAVAGADNSIHLYDVDADEVVARLLGHTGTVASMVPCGDYLASGSYDTTVRVWDLESIERQSDYGKPVSVSPMKMDASLRIR